MYLSRSVVAGRHTLSGTLSFFCNLFVLCVNLLWHWTLSEFQQSTYSQLKEKKIMLISFKVLYLYNSFIGRGISIFQSRHKQNQTASVSYKQGLRKNGTPLCAMRNIVTLLHYLACSVKRIDVSQVWKK